MKLFLEALTLRLIKSEVRIPFTQVTYFWGKVGAGKSSVARLIDFCLGADMSFTPALQQELIEAVLELTVGNHSLILTRSRDSDRIIASWSENQQKLEVLVPARKAQGIVVPGTQVEVLSDLIFHLAGINAPLVRKGRGEKTQLVRLSFRDLYRFSFLDQEGMDSDFFRLDEGADWARRQKSKDAVRFILGYHQNKVALIERELQLVHENKMTAKAAADALRRVLKDAGFESEEAVEIKVGQLRGELNAVHQQAEEVRSDTSPQDHAVDILRRRARALSSELESLEQMSAAIEQRRSDTERHLNELQMLSVRFRRTSSARSALAGVSFKECPSCSKRLPNHPKELCGVCGQPLSEHAEGHLSNDVIEQDLNARLRELRETVGALTSQAGRVARTLSEARDEKIRVDRDLTDRLQQYDSIVLSRALEFERQRTYLEQQINNLLQYRHLPQQLAKQLGTADELEGKEGALKAALNRERNEAFKDRGNLEELQRLFLDCLVRANFPGVARGYSVRIEASDFLPELSASPDEDFAVTSFANMGSGGMKSLFKCCYALALHRLSARIGAALPSVIVLDSAMKNVSERENRDLFEGFYNLVYELVDTELTGTQVLIIDKELCAPEGQYHFSFSERHMMPGSEEYPPLIPYYGVEDAESKPPGWASW